MPAEKKCRRCRCQNEHESIEGSVHVGGAAEGHGLSAGRSMATGHTVVAVVVGVIPTPSEHLEGGFKMTFAPSSHTAQKNAGPSSPAHHALEGACGWLCSRHSRCNQKLVPPSRRPPYASAESSARALGCPPSVKSKGFTIAPCGAHAIS